MSINIPGGTQVPSLTRGKIKLLIIYYSLKITTFPPTTIMRYICFSKKTIPILFIKTSLNSKNSLK